MALILATTAVAYTVLNVFVMHKTADGQAAADNKTTPSRAASATSSRMSLSCRATRARPPEVATLRRHDARPAHRAVSRSHLVGHSERPAAGRRDTDDGRRLRPGRGAGRARRITVGEIVSFVAFAGLLIGKLDQLSGFVTRIDQQGPTLRMLFDMMDEAVAVAEKPDATPLRNVKGAVALDDVTFRYGDGPQGVYDLTFKVRPERRSPSSGQPARASRR